MILSPHTQLLDVNRCTQHPQNSTQHKSYVLVIHLVVSVLKLRAYQKARLIFVFLCMMSLSNVNEQQKKQSKHLRQNDKALKAKTKITTNEKTKTKVNRWIDNKHINL